MKRNLFSNAVRGDELGEVFEGAVVRGFGVFRETAAGEFAVAKMIRQAVAAGAFAAARVVGAGAVFLFLSFLQSIARLTFCGCRSRRSEVI